MTPTAHKAKQAVNYKRLEQANAVDDINKLINAHNDSIEPYISCKGCDRCVKIKNLSELAWGTDELRQPKLEISTWGTDIRVKRCISCGKKVTKTFTCTSPTCGMHLNMFQTYVSINENFPTLLKLLEGRASVETIEFETGVPKVYIDICKAVHSNLLEIEFAEGDLPNYIYEFISQHQVYDVLD